MAIKVLKRYHRMHGMGRDENLTEYAADLIGLRLGHPAFNVYWDGDLYAIVGSPNKLARDMTRDMELRDAANDYKAEIKAPPVSGTCCLTQFQAAAGKKAHGGTRPELDRVEGDIGRALAGIDGTGRDARPGESLADFIGRLEETNASEPDRQHFIEAKGYNPMNPGTSVATIRGGKKRPRQ